MSSYSGPTRASTSDHRHDNWDTPGAFAARQRVRPDRDFARRAFTVGVGGPVGSGKTALMLALCRGLRDRISLAVVTNDIFTKEDADFLVRHQALDKQPEFVQSRPADAPMPPFAKTSPPICWRWRI